jgi:hypothetical protein
VNAPHPSQSRLIARPSNDVTAIDAASADARTAQANWIAAAERLRRHVREFGDHSVTAMNSRNEERVALRRWTEALKRLVAVVQGGSL